MKSTDQIDEAQLDAEFQQAQKAIERGERAKMLMEILREQIGAESNGSDFWKKLKQVQEEYNEALTVMSTVVKEHLQREKSKN